MSSTRRSDDQSRTGSCGGAKRHSDCLRGTPSRAYSLGSMGRGSCTGPSDLACRDAMCHREEAPPTFRVYRSFCQWIGGRYRAFRQKGYPTRRRPRSRILKLMSKSELAMGVLISSQPATLQKKSARTIMQAPQSGETCAWKWPCCCTDLRSDPICERLCQPDREPR